MKSIQNIMSEYAISINSNTPFSDACRMFKEMSIHHLPVTDEQKCLIGIFSTTDAIYAINGLSHRTNITSVKDLDNLLPIEECMSYSNLMTANINDSIEDVTTLMNDNHINCIPVLKRGKLAGIITSTDIMKYLIDSI